MKFHDDNCQVVLLLQFTTEFFGGSMHSQQDITCGLAGVSSNHSFQAILSEQLAHFVGGFPDAVRADEEGLTVLDGGGRLAIRDCGIDPPKEKELLLTLQ